MCFRLQNRMFVLSSPLFIHEGCMCFSWPLCWYDCAEISKLFLELVRPNEFLSHGLLNISRVIKIIFKMRFFAENTHFAQISKALDPAKPASLTKHSSYRIGRQSVWMEVKQWRRSALNNISLSLLNNSSSPPAKWISVSVCNFWYFDLKACENPDAGRFSVEL